LNVVEVKSGEGDWSFPTLVLLRARGGALSSESLPHEIAYQWWGSQVMPYGLGYLWLTEGLATYSDLVYRSASNQEALKHYEYRYLSQVKESEEISIVHASDERTSGYDELQGIVYFKGGLVFRMLEYLLGRETFARCLCTYAERYRFQNPTTARISLVALNR